MPWDMGHGYKGVPWLPAHPTEVLSGQRKSLTLQREAQEFPKRLLLLAIPFPSCPLDGPCCYLQDTRFMERNGMEQQNKSTSLKRLRIITAVFMHLIHWKGSLPFFCTHTHGEIKIYTGATLLFLLSFAVLSHSKCNEHFMSFKHCFVML